MMTGNKVYFDTAIFIYALENDLKEAKEMLEDAVVRGSACTGTVTVMEYCTGCYKHGRPDAAERFLAFLRDHRFELVSVDRDAALLAARIRAEHPAFKAMDALQLACAEEAGASVFCTNDKQLSGFSDDEFSVRLLI